MKIQFIKYLSWPNRNIIVSHFSLRHQTTEGTTAARNCCDARMFVNNDANKFMKITTRNLFDMVL